MRRGPTVAAAAAFAVTALAACGKSSTNTYSTTTSAASAASTTAPPTEVRTATNPKLGVVVVDAQGMTLYHNTQERGGAIVCTGGCTSAWPPLLLPVGTSTASAGPGVTGVLATVTRPDGGVQVTYNGMPLYRYAGDRRPGDANGQGVANVWFVVPANGSAAGAAATATSTSSPAKPAATTTTISSRPATTAATSTPTRATSTTTTTYGTTTTGPRVTTPCAYPPCY